MSAPNFFDFTMEHVRLAVLRMLAFEAVAHVSNESLVTERMQALGLPVTRDQLRTQLGWLEEQGLIRAERTTDGFIVVSLRERGGEVAAGRARVDGIAKPSPGR